jgi:hypothetical protein
MALLAAAAPAAPSANSTAQAGEARTDLVLMTGLPIVWGEGGAFDPESRPAGSYRMLEREFAVRPIDAIEPGALSGARLMLLAQPRLLAPEELVELDRWVRDGGHILVLTDQHLAWPSELAFDDPRRPPALPLLGPLLRRWGVRLDEPADGAAAVDRLGTRRLAFAGADWGEAPPPGRFVVTGSGCRILERPWLARCRVGRGEALLLADADLLHDSAWLGEGGRPVADNPLVIAELLDSLAGNSRSRPVPTRKSVPPATERDLAPQSVLLWVGLGVLALVSGLGFLYARSRRPTNLSTGSSTENS